MIKVGPDHGREREEYLRPCTGLLSRSLPLGGSHAQRRGAAGRAGRHRQADYQTCSA